MALSLAIQFCFLLAAVHYFLSSSFYLARAFSEKKWLSVVALRFSMAGFTLHMGALGLHFYQVGYPFLTGRFESLQLLSLLLILAFLFLCFFYRFSATGFIFVPVVLCLFLLSFIENTSYQSLTLHLNTWAAIHMFFVFFAVAVFLISLFVSLLYLISEYRIRHKKWGGIFDRFPSLEILGRLHRKTIDLGFFLFTAGIFTGAGWSKSTTGYYVSGDSKQLGAFAIWIFLALFLNLRKSRGWVGRRGVVVSGVGLLALFLLFITI